MSGPGEGFPKENSGRHLYMFEFFDGTVAEFWFSCAALLLVFSGDGFGA